MKKTIAAIAITLALAGSAFAVDMHCTKPNKWETVCEFSDGSVNVVSDFRDSHGAGDYYDDWYTAEEWARHEARTNPQQQQRLQDEATQRLCDKGDITKENCDAYFAQHKQPEKITINSEECRKNYAVHPWFVTRLDATGAVIDDHALDVDIACPTPKQKSTEDVCKELPAGANGCPNSKAATK